MRTEASNVIRSHHQSRCQAVLITGAAGYLGRQLVAALAADRRSIAHIIASDVRGTAASERLDGIEYVRLDVRSPEFPEVLKRYHIDCVVHLAAVVTPPKQMRREEQYAIDVLGTENVLKACLVAGVQHLILTSSGAAYGYHPDHPEWLDESAPLRGNQAFAYADHKRRVEMLLAEWRASHPKLRQLVFRPGAILGATTRNQITRLFERPFVLGLRGHTTTFTFIWDQDVVNCLLQGIHERRTGIYNLAGDGKMSLQEIAAVLRKPYLALPVRAVKAALWLTRRLGLSSIGPEQTLFLQYRPNLSNARLKSEFGYVPQKTSRQVFAWYVQHRQERKRAVL